MLTEKAKQIFKGFLGRSDDEETRASSSFQYEPLDSSGKEIRLLSIQPAKMRAAPIRCEIYRTRLQDADEYVALSYVWGNPNRRRPIYLNGIKVEVTVNLEQCLRQIRSSNNVGQVFWIDALCINQKNFAERSSQVTIMRDIYSNAERVIAWLGTSQANVKYCFLFVKALARAVSENHGIDNEVVSDWIASQTSPLFKSCFWMALADFLNRPYWTRAWVVQEVALSKETIVMCGKYALPWDYFPTAAAAFFTHRSTLLTSALGSYNTEAHPAEVKLLYSRLTKLSLGASKVGMIDVVWMNQLEGLSDDRFSKLYTILRMFRRTESTDPLDRVYAFLGLVDANHDEIAAISVDYAMSAANLFRFVTKQHIEKVRAIDILNDCYGIGRPDGFSSWQSLHKIEEELAATPLSSLEHDPHVVYNAASNLASKFHFDSTGEILLLDGVRIDTVKAVGAIWDLVPGKTVQEFSYDPIGVMTTWRRLIGLDEFDVSMADMSTEKAISASGSYRTGVSKAEAYWRTILCNPNAQFRANCFQLDLGVSLEHRRRDHNLTADGTDFMEINARTGNSCYSRRFYITSEGYFGLGPRVMSPGDIVCVFLGGKTPFLIRQQHDSFEVVAETYVHGLMSGEVVAEMGKGNLKVETFPLQ